MLTVIVFIIILGLLIFVHELGHFLVARRNGIRAEEFGFGFPPRIFGIQSLTGQRLKKIAEREEVDIKIADYKTKDEEVVEEVVIDKIREIDQLVPVKKWRFIWGKIKDKKSQSGKVRNLKAGTIYSLNWIPLGGFVKIKGEDGSAGGDSDSFSSKSAWVRVKVLAAGVIMNFVLAWFLITLAFMIGAPQVIDEPSNIIAKEAKIQISQVISGSPAEGMGIKAGDEIIKCKINDVKCQKNFFHVSDVQDFINSYKGKEITLEIKRGNETLFFGGVPRIEYPQEQGALGISLVQTAIVSYPWHEALGKGLATTFDLIIAVTVAFAGIIKSLILGTKIAVDISGPVGIAYLTKQVTSLGLVYIIQFAALLSINLGMINGFPFPALDGGRILFILIEKIKGTPVSRKVEQMIHTAGFTLLIALMIYVTFRDVMKLIF
jgi:regulator of sigma E protease